MNFHLPSRWSKNTAWQIYAAGLLVCGALSGAAYFFGIQPALAQREASAQSASELDARKQKADELSGSLANLRRVLTATNKDVEALPLRLEPASNINQRLARLADLAAESGLTVDEIQPEAAVDGQHFQTVPIHIGGSGTYPACAAFLHDLRSRFPDVSVKSFDVANPAPTRERAVATFHVDLTWHTAPVKK